MKTFLEYVSEDILNKYGNNLANITVVFPNKRASLFMNDALAKISSQPILTPEYKTINELFLADNNNKITDNIELVCLLFPVYKQITGSDETLDHFFSWGEIMIHDFDDIDKHLLDAHQIFTNVKDLHELDDNSFLTDDQKVVIRNFFPDFEDNNTQLKEKFLKLWSKLADIYDAFNQVLDNHHKYYEGALYRRSLNSPSSTLNGRTGEVFLIVGFNHLLPVEIGLFTILKKTYDVKFYWDFDHYYSGSTISPLVNKLFPNELPDKPEIYDNLSHEKNIRILASSTNNIQARYVNQWLQDKEKSRNTVIVLADENLLPAVLHSLPDDVGPINITIGYKLAFTNIPLFLFEKMKDSTKIDYLISQILALGSQSSTLSPLTKESIFRTYSLLNRLKDLSESGLLDVNEYTFKRLLNQLLNSTSVPFHGEPLEGIQIMGMLETRNLDFENVLLLSCNEGTLPKCNDQTSFIPYFLRKAHNLSTIDNKVNIFAYYFYHLLQRAQNVTLCWNKSTDGMLRGEMSRFMLQLKEEWNHPIEEFALHAQNDTPELLTRKPIEKTTETMQKLHQWFASRISPTAINTYLRCQKQFYYKYVLQLKEYEDEEELTDDNRTFGNVFHRTVEELYKGFVGREVTILALRNIRDENKIKKIVERFYREELSSQYSAPFDGLQAIKINVLTHYVLKLIDLDLKLAPFTLLGLEEKVSTSLSLQINGETVSTQFGGYIDRLDQIHYNGEDIIRVVDYKTGRPMTEQKIQSIEEVFDPANIDKHSDYYQQAIAYSAIINYSLPIYPSLLFIQHTADQDYDPILQFKGKAPAPVQAYQEQYWKGLQKILENIFDPLTPFVPNQRADGHACDYCPFAKLCLYPDIEK